MSLCILPRLLKAHVLNMVLLYRRVSNTCTEQLPSRDGLAQINAAVFSRPRASLGTYS